MLFNRNYFNKNGRYINESGLAPGIQIAVGWEAWDYHKMGGIKKGEETGEGTCNKSLPPILPLLSYLFEIVPK